MTKVFVGAQLCPINFYASTDSMLVCTTPAPVLPTAPNLAVAVYAAVNVLVIGTDRAEYAQILGVVPNFGYTSTGPLIARRTFALGPSETFKFFGTLRAADGASLQVLVGQRQCLLNEDINLANSNNQAECIMPPLTAGYYNISITGDNGLAYFVPDSDTQQSVLNRFTEDAQLGSMTAYHVQVYPKVTALSLQSSALLGGQTIVVSGTGFDAGNCSKNEVILAGSHCTVVSCTGTTITCIIGQAPSSLVKLSFATSRGLRIRSYYAPHFNAYSLQTLKNIPTPNTTVQADGFLGQCVNCGDSYTQWLDGFFVPKVSAFHIFYISSDDSSELFLSLTDSNINLTRISACSGFRYSYFQESVLYGKNQSAQISKPIFLNASQPYAIQARHSEGNGGDFLKVAVRVVNNGRLRSPMEIKLNSVPERQRFNFQTTIIRERQQFNFTTAGSVYFYFDEFGLRSSAAVLLNASSDAVSIQTAIKSIHWCNTIDVTRSLFGTIVSFTVTFGCVQGTNGINILRRLFIDTSRYSGVATWTRLNGPSEPLGGFFTLGYHGNWSVPLYPNTFIHEHVKAALISVGVNLPTEIQIEGNRVDSAGFVIIFTDSLHNIDQIEINASGLTGNNVVTIIQTIEDGGSGDSFFDPIPSNYLFFPTIDVPNAFVSVNGMVAACSDASVNNSACGFSYSNDSKVVPAIQSISLQGMPVQLSQVNNVTFGDFFSISGTGFGTDPDSITVLLGSGLCSILAVNDTVILCTVGHIAAGQFSLKVLHAALGFASGKVINFESYSEISSVSPLKGAPTGGYQLSVNGSGFYSDMKILFANDKECLITYFSTTFVKCIVPPISSISSTYSQTAVDSAVSIQVSFKVYNYSGAWISELLTTSYSYTYAWSMQPVVTEVFPSSFSAAVTQHLSFTGIFTLHVNGAPGICSAKVTIGGQDCSYVVVSSSFTNITCTLAAGVIKEIDQQAIQPVISLCDVDGFPILAHIEPEVFVNAAFRISSISTAHGSIAGGTTIIISGAGFISNRLNRLTVNIDGNGTETVSCNVINASFNVISCSTAALGVSSAYVGLGWIFMDTNPEPKSTALIGNLSVSLNGFNAPCISCDFRIDADVTPTINGASFDSTQGLLVVSGTGLLTNNTIITIGSTPCTLIPDQSSIASGNFTAQLQSSVTCSANFTLPAGQYPITVVVPALGRALSVNISQTIQVYVRITSIQPQSGSLAGGIVVTISGTGFHSVPTQNLVSFFGNISSVYAVVLSSNYTTIVCIAPAAAWTTSTKLTSLAVNISVLIRNNEYGNFSFNATGCANPQLCRFTYDGVRQTPIIFSVFPTSGQNGTVLRIIEATNLLSTITNISSLVYKSLIHISIGGVDCNLINVTVSAPNHWYYCTLGETPAGSHVVFLTINGLGVADSFPRFAMNSMGSIASAVSFTSIALISSFTPTTGGCGGGRTLTITGSGFSAVAHGFADLSICDSPCFVVNSTYNSIVCITSPIQTVESFKSLNETVLPVKLVNGTVLSTVSGGSSSAFDEDYSTRGGYLYTTNLVGSGTKSTLYCHFHQLLPIFKILFFYERRCI